MESLNKTRYKKLCTSTGHTYNYYTSVLPTKTTVLFLHGFPYTANIWRYHIGFFEKLGFGCIAPDMLGFGDSDKPHDPRDYCGKGIACSLVDILNEEDVHAAVVICHDWGCQVGSRVALYHPAQVSVLIMVAVPYFQPSSFDLEAVNRETEVAFGASIFGYWPVFMKERSLLEQHTDSFFCLFFAKDPEMWKRHFVGRGSLKEWLENDRKCATGEYVTDIEAREFFANDWEAATQYYHCYVENHHWKSEKGLAKERYTLTIPTLMIGATHDACAPLPLVESSLAGFRDSQFITLEGGHHIFLSQADEFNDLVAKFLEEKCIYAKSQQI